MFSYRCCRPGAGIGAEREFGPKNGSFKGNAQFLGVIRLEFGVEDGRMGDMLGDASRHAGGKQTQITRPSAQCHSRIKRYSIRTEQAYVDWIKRFILFHGKRHPGEMAEEEVAQFLTHLARDMNVAASTQNQALSALLFLYKEVLKHEIGWLEKVERAKKPPKLPVVLSRSEVKEIFAHLHG